MKVQEDNQKKQHTIEKHAEDQVRFERQTKIFEAQKKNLEQKGEEKDKTITQYEEEKLRIETELKELNKRLNDSDVKLKNKNMDYMKLSEDIRALTNQREALRRENGSFEEKLVSL